MRAACLLVALLAVAACGTDAPNSPPTAPASVKATTPASAPPFYVLGSGVRPRVGFRDIDLSDPEVRRRYSEAMFQSIRVEREMIEAVREAPDWRKAEAVVERLRNQVPDLATDTYTYRAAVRIIDSHLLRGPFHRDDADALIRHVETLHRLQSNEASVIVWSLIRLDGWWPEADRARVARATADRLGADFTRVAGCVGCTVDEALAGMPPLLRESNETRLREMKAVHDELRRIARQGAPLTL